MTEASLATDPLAVTPPVVVTVEVEAIAEGTEGIAGSIIAALQASEGVLVSGVVAELDGAQGLEIIVDKEKDMIETLPGIADHFANSEIGKSVEQVAQARDGLKMVVAVGGDKRAGDGPKDEDAVVDDVEGLRLVAKVVLSTPGFVAVGVARWQRVWRRELIGAGVEDVGSIRISRSNEATVVRTSLGVTVAFFLTCFLGSAGALVRRKKTGRTLVTTAHSRTGFHQLTVGGNAHTSPRWIARERRGGGDDAVGHQTQDQAVLTLE